MMNVFSYLAPPLWPTTILAETMRTIGIAGHHIARSHTQAVKAVNALIVAHSMIAQGSRHMVLSSGGS